METLARASSRPVQPTAPPVASPAAPLERHPELFVAGQRLHLFVEFPPLLEAMLADIRSAQQRVWLEVYIFLDDTAGALIGEALKEKARAGLDVRVLYDAIGCQETSDFFFADLAAAGVQLHPFHTLWEGLLRFRPLKILNRRDHRKLLVIDNRVGYFGGMNLVHHGHTPQEMATLPISAGWRDVHVRLEGPQLADLAESFERSWRRARHEPVRRRPRAYRKGWVPDGSDECLRFFDSGPGLKYSRAARVYTRLIKRARHSITISMAYFIPEGRVLRELLKARKRGVRIRVILPGESDVPLAQYAAMYMYRKLLRRGLAIYERSDRMLHSKVMVIDGRYSVLGSCNLDPRSLRLNLELLAVIRSETMATALLAICRDEQRHSRRIRLADQDNLSWWQRARSRLAWYFRRLL